MKALIVRGIMLLFCFILILQLWIFASLTWWRTHPVQMSMVMRLDYWSNPTTPIQHAWRDYDEISSYMKHAIVAAEDAKFVNHHGFDWDGIQTALERNQDQGKVVAGGSTISQQLAKNLFLFNQRSFLRKGQETIATWMMERMWSKRRILEVYLNSVEFGDNIYGIEAATLHYFGKSSQSLSREQAVFLASILPNPKYYQQHPNASSLQARQRMIRKYMHSSEIPQ